MALGEMVAPMDFPGGRFAILSDPQRVAFGLPKMAPHQKNSTLAGRRCCRPAVASEASREGAQRLRRY
jgi:hypothetical protein